MKFGHVFKQTLRDEGFPPDWVDSAISYSQLKKCIKRLTDELQRVGLDPPTLSKLLKHVEDYNASTQQDDDQERPFEYILDPESSKSDASPSPKAFHPKLIFYVNETSGEVLSAKLDDETKRKLQMLAVETGMSDMRVFDSSSPSLKSGDPGTGTTTPAFPTRQDSTRKGSSPTRGRPGYRTVLVPITSDTEFFTRLTSEVSGLEKLQEREQKRMNVQIEALGKQVAKLTDPDRRANRKMLTAWRQIFQLYVEEGIFFGTTELDHKSHDSEKAMARLAGFSNKIAKAGLVERLKKKDNIQALNSFMHINREILQGLRFGEINHNAMVKILKSKFQPTCSLPPPTPSRTSPLREREREKKTNTNLICRIRQAHRSRRKVYFPAPSRIPRVLRASRKSSVRRGKHADSVARAPNRRLLMSHVHGDSMAPRQAELQPHVLHPLLDCHAE